jgi:transposase-like protein
MLIKTWSDEDTQRLVELYNQEDLTIDEIGDIFERNSRSIISKLVQLRIYKKPLPNKVGKRTVKTMLVELEDLLDIKLDGLTLSKKSNLEIVVDRIKDLTHQNKKLL